jgi:hypothetical protein
MPSSWPLLWFHTELVLSDYDGSLGVGTPYLPSDSAAEPAESAAAEAVTEPAAASSAPAKAAAPAAASSAPAKAVGPAAALAEAAEAVLGLAAGLLLPVGPRGVLAAGALPAV